MSSILTRRRSLPLLDKLAGAFTCLNLKNTLIISVQHLCATTEALFDVLFELQLDPSHLYVLGKCYSTDPKVLVSLQDKGVHVLKESSQFEARQPYDITFERHIEHMLNQVLFDKNLAAFEKIILLDDGGHLLDKARALLPSDLPVVGIEQTSSGFNRLCNSNIHFPVVNLARSWMKLTYESPIIISLALRKLREKMLALDAERKEVLLIGCGTLGQGIREILQERHSMSVFDLVAERSTIAATDVINRLPQFDLVIGCTGHTALRYTDFRYLKKPVTLVSVASSDREFEAFKLRSLTKITNCHHDIQINGITLLNGGFPITFDEDYDGIDTDDFQLTRALILAAIYQAADTDGYPRGFVPLEEDLQYEILRHMRSMASSELFPSMSCYEANLV